jgi:ankyrin repeat protein
MSHLRATAESRPTLYRLAAERHYRRIPEHVALYPADVAWRDRYGSTALHLLSIAQYPDDALLTAVRAILAVSGGSYSYLVAQPNASGWTPLHLACDKRLLSPSSTTGGAGGGSNATATTSNRFWSNRELILALIHACPAAVSVTMNAGFKTNLTPFHIACEHNAPIDVLRAMLQVNPRLVTESYAKPEIHSHTDNTLQLLWTATQKECNRPHLAASNEATEIASAASHFEDDAEAKMALLLEAAYCGTVARVEHDCNDLDGTADHDNPWEAAPNEGQSPLYLSTTLACHRVQQQQQLRPSFRLLSAACSVRCPREYISTIFQRHSHQASERDETGQLPLHYACRNAKPESQAYTEFLVESLLEYYPQAASISFPLA